MQASTHNIAYFLAVFSALIAASLAVTSASSEDKKWLLDTLVSLQRELRKGSVPSYPSTWDVPDPLPTPAQWLPTGLLCCNHPPTRPPRMKRPKYTADSRWRNLVLNAIAKSFSDHSPMQASADSRSQSVQEPEDLERHYVSYYDPADSSQPEVQRRGVTVVKGGVSGINTG